MSKIRAFVGHSFVAQDESLVRIFIDYLDQMKGALSSFDWVHAQAAEPTELAAKVLKLIDGRNVFIGICTKRERVVSEEKLTNAWFDRNKKYVASADLEWKTSDWVIQEIGLAVGRNMTVVLLIENGCRKPSGLQGDVEFISFDRDAPQMAFGPLLEMVRAMAPPALQGEAISDTETPDDALPSPAPTDDELPNATWDRSRYETAFAWRLVSGKQEEAGKIGAAYLETAEAIDPVKRAEWQSLTEIWQIRFGKNGTLQRLKELKQSFPENVEISKNLAAALAQFNRHEEAATAYLECADIRNSEPLESARLRGRAAVEFSKAGQSPAANKCIDDLRNLVKINSADELSMLFSIKLIAEAEKDEALAAQVMERIVDLSPDDFSTRFDLAHKHSQLKNNDLSLHHYLQIPAASRGAAAWNNLGVAFQAASLSAKAVDAYEKAAADGGTLATSNLAYKLMNAGFLNEADAKIQNALKVEHVHRNVGEALAQLRDIPENESSALDEARAKAKPKVQFVRRLGIAISQPRIVGISSLWNGPKCSLKIEIKDDWLFASGTYVSKPGLGLGLMGVIAKTEYMVNYAGRVVGRRIFGVVTTKRQGSDSSAGALALLGEGDGVDFGMIINEDGSQISVMESPSSSSPRFYEMTPVTKYLTAA